MRNRRNVVAHSLENQIVVVRGQKVLFDRVLSDLYGVRVKALLQAVRRNIKRFPEDFVFQLTRSESDALRSQIVTIKRGRGSHRKYLPYAFTEQGVAMLSSAVKSERAIAVNIAIMRAFVKLRQTFSTHKEFANKFKQLETKVIRHDGALKTLFEAFRQLMAEPVKHQRRIGF